MDLKSFWNNVILFFGVILIYLSVMLILDTFSMNQWNLSETYIGNTHAKLNFYQNSLWTHNYSLSGSNFWSSPQYYNTSFDTVRVTHWNEPEELPVWISNIITRISRDSH